MRNPLNSLIERYKPQTLLDYENALKEIIQELTLGGLARTDFFARAAFYGGTALRIFHGLSRFSEDLDFTLLDKDPGFSLNTYFSAISENLRAFGLVVEIEEVQKIGRSTIESAFLKGNTRIHLLQIRGGDRIARHIQSNKVMRVKFEVDVQPASGFTSEIKAILPPLSASVRVLKPSSLFAGKMHAVLFRSWKNRVKGRDFYDLLWYIGQKTPLRLPYLHAKMVEGGQWTAEAPLSKNQLVSLLLNRFQEVDFTIAGKEVAPFLRDPSEVTAWNTNLFLQAVSALLVEESSPDTAVD